MILHPMGFWSGYRPGCTQVVDILLIFSSLDGTSSVRLKLCCTAAVSTQATDILLPR